MPPHKKVEEKQKRARVRLLYRETPLVAYFSEWWWCRLFFLFSKLFFCYFFFLYVYTPILHFHNMWMGNEYAVVYARWYRNFNFYFYFANFFFCITNLCTLNSTSIKKRLPFFFFAHLVIIVVANLYLLSSFEYVGFRFV